MDSLQLSFTLGTTNPQTPLGFTVLFDGQPIFTQKHVTATETITVDIPDNEGEHYLEFVMSGKTSFDTQVDDQGNIITDSCLTVTNVAFDEIELNHILNQLAEYTHDFNGTGQLVTEKFYGTMGCNGAVKLAITTPIYLWLLENM